MKRPEVSAIDRLEAIFRDIQETEGALDDLRSELRNIPFQIADQVSSQDARIEAARYLYWMVQEIPAAVIAQALFDTHVHDLMRIIGPASGDVLCDRCGKPMQFRSRSHLKEAMHAIRKRQTRNRARYAEGYTILCDLCWEEVQANRNAEAEDHWVRLQARLMELKSMPYALYLQTPEWQERRKRHLKSVGFRCQVCNRSEQPIDIHHRTYERRGEEYYKDLIALCRSCRRLFHDQGKLVDL